TAPRLDGTGGGNVPAKTQAPPVTYKTYFNERKGTVEQVPSGIDPAFNWNQGKAVNKAVLQKLEEAKQNYEKAAAVKPKKEYLTAKKLGGNIAAIDAQIKGGGDKKTVADLEAKKTEYQALLDKKSLALEKKKLLKEQVALQKEFDSLTVKTYSGIWKDDVTTVDWKTKSATIQVKKDYYLDQINNYGLPPDVAAPLQKKLALLEEFSAEGKHYYEVQTGLKQIQNSLTALKKGGIVKPGLDDAFSEARKNAALWAKSPKEADEALREVCGRVWQKATKVERKAIYDYTCGSGGFNRPLRGYDKDWHSFKGIGKVDLNNEGRAKAIKEMTDLINNSSYDIDIWLQRGVETSQGAASFLGISEKDLRNLTQGQLERWLLNEDITDQAFVSCGSAKGKGFGGYIFNIFCPKGTKMMYSEPFSSYGRGTGLNWNGIAKQLDFGHEDETIIQRGTTFKVIKIEKKGGNTYFDLAVVSQITGG
ncbi:MAG: ADP-ribosyltransferase, partial [Treponema sp.]|nr:ADP-ribosyltransferase [Treponema sp.]